jgi:hypothetical protein
MWKTFGTPFGRSGAAREQVSKNMQRRTTIYFHDNRNLFVGSELSWPQKDSVSSKTRSFLKKGNYHHSPYEKASPSRAADPHTVLGNERHADKAQWQLAACHRNAG